MIQPKGFDAKQGRWTIIRLQSLVILVERTCTCTSKRTRLKTCMMRAVKVGEPFDFKGVVGMVGRVKENTIISGEELLVWLEKRQRVNSTYIWKYTNWCERIYISLFRMIHIMLPYEVSPSMGCTSEQLDMSEETGWLSL